MLSGIEFQPQLLKADDVALRLEALRVQPVEQIEKSSPDGCGQNSNDQPLGTIQREDVIPAITEKLAHWIASAPNNPIRFSISMLMGMPSLEVATRSVAGKRQAATSLTRRLRVKKRRTQREVR